MKVLILHNRYRVPGGEEIVVEAERDLLCAHGVEATLETFDNETGGPFTQIGLAYGAAWSRGSYDAVLELCKKHRPDVVHVHNFWMRLSPAAHAAAHAYGAATVQSLHNFRIFCGGIFLMRDGRNCEECLDGNPWRAVRHRCYRGSVVASAAAARMISINQARRTWQDDVDAFIAPSRFVASKAVAGGLRQERVFVKPHFLADPGEPATRPSDSSIFVYAGRLSSEKGVRVLVDAWGEAGLRGRARLIVVGDGPERETLLKQAESLSVRRGDVVFTGRLSHAEVGKLIAGARAVVQPSICYETFGNAVMEAACCGRPAIVSDTGALAENVQHLRTGLISKPGDAAELARNLKLLADDGPLADRLGAAARTAYLDRFTPRDNFARLMEIYQFARGGAESAVRAPNLSEEKIPC